LYDAVFDCLSLIVQCDAINGSVTHDTWRLRCSFPVYLIAMSATAGAAHQQLAAGFGALLMIQKFRVSLSFFILLRSHAGPKNAKKRNLSAPQ